MEVLLAKNRLQKRLAVASNETSSQRIYKGCRVIVREGRDFANFRTGDEGVVSSVEEEAVSCEIIFDGTSVPITVARRHLQAVGGEGLQPSPRKTASSAPGSVAAPSGYDRRAISTYRQRAERGSSASDKRTVARWKTVLKNSESPPTSQTTPREDSSSWFENGTPQAPAVPATWQNEEGSPSGPSESMTELADAETILRHAVHESASAIDASLRVVQAMDTDKTDVLGQKGRVIMLSEETFAAWQRAVMALQNAAVHCSKALHTASSKTRLNSSIMVPVESLGFRKPQPPCPMHPPHSGMPGALQGMSVPGLLPTPLFRAPPPFEGSMSRSTSAPLLNGAQSLSHPSSMMYPHSPSGLIGAGGSTQAPAVAFRSPRYIPGGVSSAQKLGMPPQPVGPGFMPSLPALSEVNGTQSIMLADGSVHHPGVGQRFPSAALAQGPPSPHTFPPLDQVNGVPHGNGSIYLVANPYLPMAAPAHGHPNAASSPAHPNAHVLTFGVEGSHGVRTRGLSAPPAKGQAPPRSASKRVNLSKWLNDEVKKLHRGLMGSDDDEDAGDPPAIAQGLC